MPEILTVRTRALEIAYEAHGSASGVPIVLLHGFPDDARAWDGVVPPLTAAGYRVLVPYLRGYGPTRFLDPDEPRMAQQAAIGQDLLDFMDALGVRAAGLAGYDWGGRAACIAAILAPERVRGSRDHRRLQRPEHADAGAAGLGRGRALVLVSVVLQHRARPAGARDEPPRDLPAPVERMVADLAIRSGDLRPHGSVVRQPRLRGRGDPLVPPPSRQRAGRPAPGRDRAPPRPETGDHRSHHDPARRRRTRWDRPVAPRATCHDFRRGPSAASYPASVISCHARSPRQWSTPC